MLLSSLDSLETINSKELRAGKSHLALNNYLIIVLRFKFF